jgi:hypothetical protein
MQMSLDEALETLAAGGCRIVESDVGENEQEMTIRQIEDAIYNFKQGDISFTEAMQRIYDAAGYYADSTDDYGEED